MPFFTYDCVTLIKKIHSYAELSCPNLTTSENSQQVRMDQYYYRSLRWVPHSLFLQINSFFSTECFINFEVVPAFTRMHHSWTFLSTPIGLKDSNPNVDVTGIRVTTMETNRSIEKLSVSKSTLTLCKRCVMDSTERQPTWPSLQLHHRWRSVATDHTRPSEWNDDTPFSVEM